MVNLIDRLLVVLIAVTYIGVLAYCALSGDERTLRLALVPAITFALVSLLRALLDKPRPYEMHAIDPIIVKDTQGKSMPSRHLASAVIIACALSWYDLRLGIPAFIACAIVGAMRIIGGVHFPRDIIAAAALALACGIVGFVLVP
jgi:membrane-associated phospholipid phosphatase